ncbi:Hypothetical_protein [Hexamita inflata]|uniref:Hypothetical_protein n=1 Tax=Hexamita inflata TaxID=28002 RepID=A0ABP1GSX4_9EUKA
MKKIKTVYIQIIGYIQKQTFQTEIVVPKFIPQEYTQKVNFKLFTLTQLIFILAQQYVQSCRIDVIVLLTQIITAFEKYYQYIIQSTNSGYASPKIIPAIPKIVTKQCQFKCRTNLGCLRRLFRVTILEDEE